MFEDITSMYQFNQGLPLQYGNLYQNAYKPYFDYLGSQASNRTTLGNTYLGAAGQLGQQRLGTYGNMASTAMPLQMQARQFNSIAPVLSGLLNEYGDYGNIGPVSERFDDMFSGFNQQANDSYGRMNSSYNNAMNNQGGYDNEFRGGFTTMLDRQPTLQRNTRSRTGGFQSYR